MSDLKQLAINYFETFSRKDLDGLAKLFTDNPSLRDWTGLAEGKANVSTANKNIFDSVETITVTPTALYQDSNTVSAELDILINGTEKLLVVDVITFEGDKISSVRAYKG
jgi:hypothetical protein